MKRQKFDTLKNALTVMIISASLSFQACENNNANTIKADADNKKITLPDSLIKHLQVQTVQSTALINSITLTGKVAFNDENVIKIYPLVSGNAQDIKMMLGDYVQKGQALATIRSSEMAGYSSDLITARTNLALAKKNMDATEDMSKSGLVSAKDLLAAQSGYEQAKAALEKAERILQINGGNTNGEYIVKSPINGFIVEKFVNNNMAIRADNGTNLFTISDLKNVWVMANVYESSIADIKTGENVQITTLSYPGKVFTGKIDKIMNALDPANKVMRVRIVLANPGYLLKPEMFTSITVHAKENKKMPGIPSSALIFDNNQYYVLIYKSTYDITIRPVQVASVVDDTTYIAEGLTDGERIITDQSLLIYQELNG
jgi:cobalt-zinc-cadmium efflux system membrane fusion protein